MAQDRRYARIRHQHVVADITDLTATLDAGYLRLDATNDPLTGELTTQALVPDGDETRDFGTEAVRYAQMNSGSIFVRRQRTDTGITLTTTVGASAVPSHNFISEAANIAFSGGTQSVTLNNTPANGAPAVNVFSISGAAPGAVDLAASLPSPGSLNLVNVFGTNPSAGTVTITNQLQSSLFMATIATSGSQSYNLLGGNASNQGGNIVGGYITTFGGGAFDATIQLNLGGFLTGGAVAFGFANAASIVNTAAGSFCMGFAQGGAMITNTGTGSFVFGDSRDSGSTLQATGRGCFVSGKVEDGAMLQATADGAMATGYVFGGATAAITASGLGSFAHAYISTNGIVCTASATNSVQWGPGTNAEADTVSVGSGIRLKGTSGAPGTPRNGDIYVNGSGQVIVRAAGRDVLLGQSTTWGAPTGTATRTTFATGSVTLVQLAERVKALIDDLTASNIIN